MNPPFLMGTTSSITMQSLGKIVQRTPAVGAKMWCLLPARRRPQGLVVIGVCLSVCLSVCAHSVCPQDISRTGSWITTEFGAWEQGVNL